MDARVFVLARGPGRVAGRRIDLHSHTVVSDGTLTPTQLVELAARKGLAAIAITDHDHTGALDEARRAGERLGVEIVPGVELSVAYEKGDVHLLGYLLDPDEPRLAARLAEFRETRARRGVEIVAKLRALGVDVTLEDVGGLAASGGTPARGPPTPPPQSIGRPHIARALVEKGIVASVQEAFEKWLADDGPAYVPKAKLAAAEAAALVHGAGGVAVLAHPGLIREGGMTRVVRALAALGLDGVEVEHPRHTSDTRRTLRALAKELDLVETGGSDFHGENKPDVDLGYGVGGNIDVREVTLAELKTRAARARNPSAPGT